MPVKAAFQGWLLIVLLVLVSVYDIRKRMIPDQLQIAIACLAALNDSWITLLGIFGALPYLCVVYVSDDGIGGGDIKLAASTGLVFGLAASLTASLLGLAAFTAFGVTCSCIRRLHGQKGRTAFPVGPFLAAGSAAAYFMKIGGLIL